MELTRWLIERPTPLMWVSGPAGSGKTTGVETALGGVAAQPAVLRVSAFRLDDALTETGLAGGHERLTAKLLLELATDRRIVVIDGLDALQQTAGRHAGDITDCRLRQLMLAACGGALPGAAIIVTSRMAPSGLLPEGAVTVMNLHGTSNVAPPALPASGSLERRVLEFAALSRGAIDAAALRRMSAIEEPVIHHVLSSATSAGLVTRVKEASYQLPDWMRSVVLSDAARTDAVREAAIVALRQDGGEPRRLLDLLVDDRRIADAVNVYWHSIGNFARLHDEGLDHFGAQLCRRLNDGLGPDEVSRALRASGGAWAVMNDWSQFAGCCGDAGASAPAAESAYQLLPKDRPQWDAARLAVHAGQAHLAAGHLTAAMEWCERGWNHARQGVRMNEGVAVREVMDAYDWSANTIAKIYLRLDNPSEIRRLIDDLCAIHERARQSIAEFNAGSSVPLEGPSGEVIPEQLIEGRLTAMLALAEGRFSDLVPLAAVDAGTQAGRELRTLLLRAAVSVRRGEQAAGLLQSLRDSAERRDDCAEECELAVLAQLTLADAARRLDLVEAYLPRAEVCGLGMHWRDLQIARARALEESGRRDDARGAAEAALFGAAGMDGAHTSRDWPAVREAVGLLQQFGVTVADHVLVDLEQSAPPARRSPRKAEKQRPAPSDSGEGARTVRHAAALRIVEAYQNDGMPFALYFRKFGVDVLHGPFELGPKLTENALRDALPEEVEVVTIQDHDSTTYDFQVSRFRREAPALLLDNESWEAVARALVPLADLIVSEPLMLSGGVRKELQMIYDAQRWDRTVLLLPPFGGSMKTVDSDGLIQMFPRCVWADSLHNEPFTSSPVVADLLERVRAIARLPVEVRRTLSDLQARDKAHPVDLVPVAQHLETGAQLGSVFNQEDEATRYYAFWQMFRASSIRGMRYRQGDTSTANRCTLAQSYIEMSKIMLDHTTEGDRFILQGDPAEAQLLVQSAYGLLQGAEDDLWVRTLRTQAEDQWEELLRLQQAIESNANRFEIQPRYGPLVLGKSGQSDT